MKDKVELIIDRTLAGLKAKVNKMADAGYAPEGSFNKTKDGRWFMQTMVLQTVEVKDAVEIPPNKPKKSAPKKAAKAKK